MAKSMNFLNNVNTDKVDTLMNETENNSVYFDEIVNSLVSKYCKDLDDIMIEIKNELNGELLDIDLVENYFLKLTNAVYFLSEQSERISIYNDLSSAARQEVYNKAYLDSSSERDEKGKSKNTVAENQAVAEDASQYESVVSLMYEHAYALIKTKAASANTMISTLSKILSRRMQEMQLSQAASKVGAM